MTTTGSSPMIPFTSSLTAFLHLLPAIVVTSLGLTITTNCPTLNICTSTILGVHGYGSLISPTSRSTGFGS